jgi:hypothetical protein
MHPITMETSAQMMLSIYIECIVVTSMNKLLSKEHSCSKF